MKTLSKGRKTPINNFDDLSYCRKSVSYIKQSKEHILNANNFYDLQNDSLMISHEQTIQMVLRLSNCTTTSDLFCALSYDYLKTGVQKLGLISKSKWLYKKEFKGFYKRILNDNDFGIDFADLKSGSIKNNRFTIRKQWTHSLRTFSHDDVTIYTNEELYLHFDALQLAQLIETEKDRPTCIDELIILLVKRAYEKLVSYYANQMTLDADFVSCVYEGKVRFINHYEIKDLSTLYPELGTTMHDRKSFKEFLDNYNRHKYEEHKFNQLAPEFFTWYVFYDKFVDYTPFLNAYGKLFNKCMNIEVARQESNRMKAFHQLNPTQQRQYNRKSINIIRRIKEILE